MFITSKTHKYEFEFDDFFTRKLFNENMICAGHEEGFTDACQDPILSFYIKRIRKSYDVYDAIVLREPVKGR